jgi:hypothetical protein
MRLTANTSSIPFTGVQVVSFSSNTVAVTFLSAPASIKIFAVLIVRSPFEGSYFLSPAKLARNVCLSEVPHCFFKEGAMFAMASPFSFVVTFPINVPAESSFYILKLSIYFGFYFNQQVRHLII